MIRRIAPVLAAAWIVAQLGDYGTPTRCWVLEGVAMPAAPAGPGPFWLNQDAPLHGAWLEYAPVRGEGQSARDAAARSVGFRDAKECR